MLRLSYPCGLSRTVLKGMKIYTKTGDKGTTGLYSGERIPKSHLIFEVLGTNDELTSHVGLSIEHCKKEGPEKLDSLVDQLVEIQSQLQDLNSHIATTEEAKSARFQATRFDVDGKRVAQLESWIDSYDGKLPPLKNFILPSGGLSAASLHVARSVCRRSERCVQRLVELGHTDNPPAIYLNRLSDYLFMAARFATWTMGLKESVYRK